MSGAEHGRENLLGVRAARAPVAAADFAHRDGRPNGVLGAPVGRVDGGVAEEREQGRGFDGEVRGETLDGRQARTHGGEEVERLFEQPASRAGEPVRGHRSCGVTIAQRQGLLKALLDTPRKRTAGMVDLEQPTATQQMRETGLMDGVPEASVDTSKPAICRHRKPGHFGVPRRS